MREKITDRLIRTLAPNLKDYEVRDTELPGFCLIVRPTGKMSFCYRYRAVDGKNKKITLGYYGQITTTQARKIAVVNAGAVAAGVDVQLEKKEGKAEAARLASRCTVKGLFDLWSPVELATHKDAGADARRTIEKHVLPIIGHLPVEAVRKNHIAAVLDPILTRGTPRMAKVVLGKMRQMFRFAIERDLTETDPTATFKKSKVGGREVERDRFLDETEIRDLAEKIPHAAILPSTEAAIWIQLATCCRVGELLKARWEHVDLKASTWYLPAENSKNGKPHTIYLSEFATNRFETLKSLTGKSAYCYPNSDDTGPVDPKTVTRQVGDRQLAAGRRPLSKRSPYTDALKLKGGKWTPHDLRRTGATLMTMLGVLPEVAERCLNHAEENRIKRIYQRYSYLPEMRDAWHRLGTHLCELTRGTNEYLI